MKHLTPSNNVPGAKQGTADSLAAPGRVGAGGTKRRRCPAGCTCTTCTIPSNFSGRFELDPTLERFDLWLQARASSSAGWVRSMDPLRVFAEDVFLDAERDVQECLAAAKLLAQFKLEQGA